MKSTLTRESDQTIELTITIPWSDIAATYETVVVESVAEAEISGFRKGKAPRAMVEQGLDKNKVYEETIKRLVPKAYTDAVTEQQIKPIMMPEINLKSAEEGKDWVLSAKTCERPQVTLGDYKKAVADVKAQKAKKIIVPGKEPDKDENKPMSMDQILGAILTAVTVEIPAVLIEHEVTHQLSQLVDQTKKLGLTVEQYLTSTNKTADSIKKEYAEIAANNLKLEFALEAIADKEQVAVSDAEIETVLKGAKTAEERANLEGQRYYLTSLIRRQKTLDLLAK